MPRQRIETNNSIAPWMISRVSNAERSYQINGLRQQARNRLAYRYYHERHVTNSSSEFISMEMIFPLIRRTLDRVWRDYIFPVDMVARDQNFVITSTISSNSILSLLADHVRFDTFSVNRSLCRRDLYPYKYCVLIAGFNILHQIFKFQAECGMLDLHRYFPIDHILCNYTNNPCGIITRLGRNSYKIDMGIEKFIELINYIPTPGFVRGSYEQYLDLWSAFWLYYKNCVFQNPPGFPERLRHRRRIRTPLLMEEYFRREIKQAFISKEQVIAMISESLLPEKVLNSIHDIVVHSEK